MVFGRCGVVFGHAVVFGRYAVVFGQHHKPLAIRLCLWQQHMKVAINNMGLFYEDWGTL